MSKLFETITLPVSGKKLKNRIAMSPMTTESGYFDGSVPNELIDYYTHRSGDAAMIIVESCFVDDKGRGFSGAIGINSDDKLEGLSQLAAAIKQKGSLAVVQIYHAGRMAFPEMNGGSNPIAPSSIAALRPNAPIPDEMNQKQILDMIQSFAEATRRAIRAGFDGVELHGANTYLLQQFFSPHSNRRSDEWGGSREKRMRFAIEVIKAVKKVIDEEGAESFIVGYRFSPEELEEPGIRFDDTMYFLNTIANYGLDYVHFSMGIYTRTSIVEPIDPQLLIQKFIEGRSEQLAKIPVIGVGAISQARDAKQALELGYDIVAVGKSFLVEPDWVSKIKNNQETKTFADLNEREELVIPVPLWHFMDDSFDLVKDAEEEKIKAKRLEELKNKKLSFKAGTYNVIAKGHNNDLPMAVTFSEDKITTIAIDNSEESEGLSDTVIATLPEEIISSQTLNVDAVSGASTTSLRCFCCDCSIRNLGLFY